MNIYRWESTGSMTKTVCWRYGVIFCNTFLIFGFYYSTVTPTGVQNEIMGTNQQNSSKRKSDIRNQTDCEVCLGLGEVRYNVLFSTMRWASAIVCVPSGYMLDRLGNRRSAILLNGLTLLGSVLFTVGAISHAPTTTPLYVLMVAGRAIMAVGDGSIRLLQTRVIACCFPGDTFIPLAFATTGLSGQGFSYLVTPNVAAAAGFSASLWLGFAICGFSFCCSVVLAVLLQNPCEEHGIQEKEIPTLKNIRALPKIFWLFIWTIAFGFAPWICKQTNLPDYLKLKYGYTMTEAGYINSVPCFVMLFAPAVGVLLRRIDCNGVVLIFSIVGSIVPFALLGFCPEIHPAILAIADGICIAITSVIQVQLLVVISPAAFVGTLGGILYLVRHVIAAFLLLVSGYVLEKPERTDIASAMRSYQHFFLMLILVTSMSAFCVVVMNVLDIREACSLNTRIGKWRKSDVESTELMSGIQSSSKYS